MSDNRTSALDSSFLVSERGVSALICAALTLVLTGMEVAGCAVALAALAMQELILRSHGRGRRVHDSADEGS